MKEVKNCFSFSLKPQQTTKNYSSSLPQKIRLKTNEEKQKEEVNYKQKIRFIILLWTWAGKENQVFSLFERYKDLRTERETERKLSL